MKRSKLWLVSFVIISACTCGVVKTECNTNRAQIAFLTAVHDDPACRQLSPKGVLLYEAAKHIADAHNNESKGFKIEVVVQDTCGSIAGSLRAAMKAMVMADVNCLQPPSFLGIIGPDSMTNAEAINKVTSLLKVPLVVKKTNNAPYMHYLSKESDSYIVKGVLKLLETLKWKSFTLVANSDEDNEDDVQSIAKKLTMEAIAKNLCVMIHDKEDDDYSSRIVHIGKPSETFFSEPINATILIVSEGNLEKHLNEVESTNNILLLEDSRNDFNGLEEKVEQSTWWSGSDGGEKYDTEELRDVRWLEDAIESYAKALDSICKKKKCKHLLNSADWNNVLANVLESHNANSRASLKTLELSFKVRGNSLQEIGQVLVHKSTAKLYWKGESVPENDEDFEEDEDDGMEVPDKLKKLMPKDKSIGSGCATSTTGLRILDDDVDDEATPIFVSEMDDSEWWTMVATVSGVGVGMFVVGILAVYIVISNIRGPRPKSSGRFERDTSLRRVGSDREITTSRNNSRPIPQRNDSMRSNLSEKSV